MASIILAAAGTTIGGTVGGAFLGVSAATIGDAVGSPKALGAPPSEIDFERQVPEVGLPSIGGPVQI